MPRSPRSLDAKVEDTTSWKRPETGFVMHPRRGLAVPYALSGLLAVLLLASSVVGLLFGGRGFNALFLVYIAIVSASLYDLLSLLFAIDAEALKARFGARTPTRFVGGFFVGISLLFVLMWGLYA